MTTYIVTHTHRRGVTNYMFESSNPDLNISLHTEDNIYDENTQKVVEALNIGYEHGRWGESLEIVDIDLVNDLKTIEV